MQNFGNRDPFLGNIGPGKVNKKEGHVLKTGHWAKVGTGWTGPASP